MDFPALLPAADALCLRFTRLFGPTAPRDDLADVSDRKTLNACKRQLRERVCVCGLCCPVGDCCVCQRPEWIGRGQAWKAARVDKETVFLSKCVTSGGLTKHPVRHSWGGRRARLSGPPCVFGRVYLVDPASSICLSQRLSHACLSTSRTKVKLRMAH